MSNKLSPLKFVAQTNLPTASGSLVVRAYRNEETGQEPIAIISGDLLSMEAPPVRVHDACFTSEVLGSLKCDCVHQLQSAIQYIQQHSGAVLYLHQEGRGIGLANKLAAYALQEQGLDTIEANRALHLPDDCRDYTDAADILKDLGIQQIQLLTNNPRKIEKLTALGIKISERISLPSISTPQNSSYLQTKIDKMGHLINFQKEQNKDID